MTDTVIEKRNTPDWITDEVNRIGGLNRFGGPNYRVIWGGSRTHLVGGKFKDVLYVKSDEHLITPDRAIVTEVPEIRTLLKYHPFRWHLERWRGPEFYGTQREFYEQTWDEECKFHTQGPYPAMGDYEHIFYLAMCPHMKSGDAEWCSLCKASSGEYIPLEENFKLIELMIYAFHKSDGISRQAERRELFLREAQKRQAREKRVGEIVRGVMRPQLATQPTSWQDGSRCSVPEPKMTTALALPRNRMSFGQSNTIMPNKRQKELDNGG